MKTRMFFISLIAISLLFASQSHAVDQEDIAAVWLFDEGSGKKVEDSEGQGIDGTIVGSPEWVNGQRDKALVFDGDGDYITVPDSSHINTGTFTNRTIMALFKCNDVSINDRKQTIYEEGGRTRGAVIYVYDGELYISAWNRAEYNWNGEWPKAEIKSNEWYYVALVLRDTQGKVEDDKFEMWLNGELIEKTSGGQLHSHSDDNAIGAVVQNTVFHDEDGSGGPHNHFGGTLDELRIYNTALTEDDMNDILKGLAFLAVKPESKLAATWGKIKW